MRPDLTLDLGNGLHLRALVPDDAALLAEATRGETARSLWGARPAGPYLLPDARAALAAWAPAAGGQFSLAIPRVWLEINPGNEPSLRVAQRVGYHFEERRFQHCRDWATDHAGHDSWHDCLIWAHVEPQAHSS